MRRVIASLKENACVAREILCATCCVLLGLCLFVSSVHAIDVPESDINEKTIFVRRETRAPSGTIGEPSTPIGDVPTYVSPHECPEPAQRLIQERHLPLNQINSCKISQPRRIGLKTYNAVEIAYGPGRDCPAGCFYARVTAAVPSDGGRSIPLPIWRKDWLFSEAFYHCPGYGLTDSGNNGEPTLLMDLVEHDGHLGWQFTILKIQATWFQASTGEAVDLRSPNNPPKPGHWRNRIWSGIFFGYGDGQNILWDTRLVQFHDESRNPPPKERRSK